VYPALEGLVAVVYRGLVPPPSRIRPSMCMPVTPAVPYLLLGLQDVQWAVGNSRGARKLARTPHVNKKKKKKDIMGPKFLIPFSHETREGPPLLVTRKSIQGSVI
jgi:hypothetical protein